MKKIWMSLLASSLMLAACNNQEEGSSEATTENGETVTASMDGHEGHNHGPEVATKLPSNTVEVEAGPAAAFEFEETTYEYGEVKQGAMVEHTFKFKNVGEVPLVIQNATASCGCTVPNPPKEPIPVGETGEIAVKFDTNGKLGMNNKRVTITANTSPAQTFLELRGNILPKTTMPEGGPLKQ